MDRPSLSTLIDILQSTVKTWFTCEAYAIPKWTVEFVFYLSLILASFYFYVISAIIYHRRATCQFRTPFYNCVLLLAVGDIGTILTCCRVTMPQCAFELTPARYLAWESLTTFFVDIIYGINLVIATIRLEAVSNYLSARQGTKRTFSPKRPFQSTYILNILISLVFFFAVLWGLLWFFGYAKRIWFPPEDQTYHGELLFPVSYIRTPWSMSELGLTFLIYCFAFYRLRKLTYMNSKGHLRKENRLMVLAVLIFSAELLFIYSSDWLGFVWGLGDAKFNASVSYFGRPITTGITPVFYLLFSADVRQACFPCCRKKTSTVNSSTGAGIAIVK